MSQEEVGVVRALFAAFADRDTESAATLLHPEVEIRPAIVGGPEGVVYRGVSGNTRFWADIDSAWTEFRDRRACCPRLPASRRLRTGLRLLCSARPGLGQSAPTPGAAGRDGSR
jgi:hypothetical protein